MSRRSLITLATLLAALGLAPDAWAKGPITSLQVCGADGCASVPVPARLKSPMGVDRLMMSARAAAQTPSPGPFYRLRVGMGAGSSMSFYYLPGGKLLRDQDWVVLGKKLRAAIDGTVAAHPPVVPAVETVTIGSRRVPDPEAYAPLLGRLPVSPGSVDAAVIRSVGIYLTTSGPSPWGLGRVVFALYDPRTRLVDIGGTVRVPPQPVRRAIDRDAGIAIAPSSEGGGSGSGVMWAGGATAAAASAGLLLVRRRRRRGGER
jgi:hypothetical protein